MKIKYMYVIVVTASIAALAWLGCFRIDQLTADDEKMDNINVDKIPKVAYAKACNKTQTQCIDDVLLLVGEITERTRDELNELLLHRHTREPSAICVYSQGGSVLTAFDLGRWILKTGLPTCIAETYLLQNKENKSTWLHKTKCSSACNFLLLASNHRISLGAEFTIGMHSAGFCFCDISITYNWVNPYLFDCPLGYCLLGREDNPDRASHLAFLDAGKKIPLSENYHLTEDDIQKFKIFTERR